MESIGMTTRSSTIHVKEEKDTSAKVNWNLDDNRKAFIDVILESLAAGDICTDNDFKSKVWKKITEDFNKRTKLGYSKSQLQNQLGDLKKKYNIFKALKDKSGFRYDEVLNYYVYMFYFLILLLIR
jgi:hypothetical protein